MGDRSNHVDTNEAAAARRGHVRPTADVVARLETQSRLVAAVQKLPALYREVTERIRAAEVDVVLNLTAGMGGDMVFGSTEAPLPLNQGMRGWFWTGHYTWTDDQVPARLLYRSWPCLRAELDALRPSRPVATPSRRPGWTRATRR